MYKLCDDKQFSNLYEDIEKSMQRWAKVQATSSKICAANMAVFHTFPTLHLNSLRRLETNKMNHHAIYEKFGVNLDKKKDKAFRSQDMSRWEINNPDPKLLQNREEAFKAMFPKDNAELETLKNNYYFMVNQCYKEIKRTNRYDMFNTLNNYTKMSERIKDNIYEHLQIWTDFEMKYKDAEFPPEKDDIYAPQITEPIIVNK